MGDQELTLHLISLGEAYHSELIQIESDYFLELAQNGDLNAPVIPLHDRDPNRLTSVKARVSEDIFKAMQALADRDQLLRIIPALAIAAATNHALARHGHAFKQQTRTLKNEAVLIKSILRESETALQRHKSSRKRGAQVANAQHKSKQEQVFQWLEDNFRPARSHEEMAAEMEKIVKRKFGTILKDITAWKKKRKR